MKKVLAMTVFLTAFALALSFFGAKDASADAVVAPAFRTDGNFITFVTVVNKSNNTSLHWMYRYDDPSTPGFGPFDPVKKTGNECFHADGFAKTTQNDMFTVDISNTFDGGKPIPSSVDTTSGSYNIGKGWLGFLTIYSFTGTYPGTMTIESTLNAEVVIANLSTGEAYSYKAANDGFFQAEGVFPWLGDTLESYSFPPIPSSPTAIWHPTSAVTTQWYVMLVHDQLEWGTGIQTVSFTDAAGLIAGFYDINENLWSATSGKTIACFGYLTLSDFIAPASLPLAANGGWARVHRPGQGASGVLSNPAILVYKLESTSALVSGKTQTGWTSQNRLDW
jgi:hypothetical protein